MQVLRLQEHRRSVNLEEIPMIDHVDNDTILEEDESETSIVESESLTIPSIVITPILNKKEVIVEDEDGVYKNPPLAEPESLVLPSIVTKTSEEDVFEKDVYDPVLEKSTKLVIPNTNQRIVAMLFRSLPFCSDSTVIE